MSQVLSDERSRKRYDYALAHPEEDIQVRVKRSQPQTVLQYRSASAHAWLRQSMLPWFIWPDRTAHQPSFDRGPAPPVQEEPYGIWKYWRTDARAVILGFLAVISAIQYFGKLSAYDSVGHS